MGGTRFMVQWEEHPSHLATRLGQLLEHQTLVDVTLMCNTHTLRVHRAVLAACSPYFETILQRQLGMHPLIVLKDMQFSVLKSLIEFMYCGETSVTEDNLGALLQAAKFFQVKGLSAMTKEALGLGSGPKSTVNGDAARKAFVGRPKRVGMQQTFVTSGLKALPSTHTSSSHGGTVGNELATLSTKTTFQTISKPVAARPDTQQQADTAQLLLSLSGSEFPKQTFHTVSKNVRFHHNVSGSTVTSGAVDGNSKKEVVGRIPVMSTPNGGVKTTTVAQQGGQLIEYTTKVGTVKEEVMVSNPQSAYIPEGSRRRGRPIKRQMNMLVQDKVMTDADMALHKEAEASRRALEMLRQEMSSDSVESNATATSPPVVAGAAALPARPAAVAPAAVVAAAPTTASAQITNLPADQLQKAPVKQTASVSPKIQVQPAPAPVAATNSRIITASQTISTPIPAKRVNTNVVSKPAANPVTTASNKKNPPATSNLSDTTTTPISKAASVALKVDEGEQTPQQVYQIANETVQEVPREEAVEFQVSTEATEGEGVTSGANNNIVTYQVADASCFPASMSQYVDALKEAGIAADGPIYVEGPDGAYLTLNEEMYLSMVNGQVLQVAEGSIVTGDGVEFFVQSYAEDEMEVAAAAGTEQAGEGAILPKEGEGAIGVVTQGAEAVGPPAEGEAPKPEDVQAIIPSMEDGNCIIPDMEPETGPLVGTSEARMENKEVNEAEMNYEAESREGEPKGEVTQELANGTYNVVVAAESLTDPTPKPDKQTPEVPENDQENYEDGKMQTCEVPERECVQEEVKEGQNVMSVEQALQAMMGEGSDTEAEVEAPRDESQEVPKEDSVPSGLETVTQPEEKQPTEDLQLVLRSEEGTENLRLVLSHGEELVKEERQREDTSSFTLVLSNEGTSEVPDQEARCENGIEIAATTAAQDDVPPQIVSKQVNADESIPQSGEFEHSSGDSVLEEIKEAVSESVILQQECSVGDVETGAKAEGNLLVDNNIEFDGNIPGSELGGESQEVVQLTSNPVVRPAASKHKGAVTSPSKDIPFAVGLLPLKTALEKLQAMPEYHPRKTRSSSTGKESTADMPAPRVKRKASSSDGPEKRLKVFLSEADTIAEEEGAASASMPEDRKEGAALSMPELVTDPTEG